MRKKLKGSAMLWSVCSLLIVVFVLTGLLALNKSYAEEEINNIASRRAEYLARSGAEFTADLIIDGKLTDGDIKNVITRTSDAVITYDWGTVKVERAGDDIMRIISEASAGNMSRTVTALVDYDITKKKWELRGYATN